MGAARDFAHPVVVQARESNLYDVLWRTHLVDTFAIFAADDRFGDQIKWPNRADPGGGLHFQGPAAIYEALGALRPVFVSFMNTSLPLNARPWFSQRLNQFARFRVCREQMLLREQQVNVAYEWIVRTRPDIRYERPLPPLSSLRVDAVSGRLRCIGGQMTTLPRAALTESIRPLQGHDTLPACRRAGDHSCQGDQGRLTF